MLKRHALYSFVAWLNLLAIHLSLAADSRSVTSFDTNWRFVQQDDPAAGNAEFDDSKWRQLDVPHDWSIESTPNADNPTGGAGGFFAGGVGWYRKQFTLNQDDSTRRIFIDFESVMANSDVFINGFNLGHRPSGYAPLHYELTGHLNFDAGKSNVLAVRVDQSQQPSSRYYTGAGILGHVHLLILNPVHFQHNSLFITTPTIDADKAVIQLRAAVVNQSDTPRDVVASVELRDPDGHILPDNAEYQSSKVAAGKTTEISEVFTVTNPSLWDLEHPRQYSARVTLVEKESPLDNETVTFGIRSIKFEPATGFSLNGKKIRLQGVCLHADNSCFGTAVPTSAWERRLAALKPFGVNALRTAHNPPTPEFLDLCDRMGFLVMDEMFDCWDVAKNPFDYHLYFDQWSLTDLRDAVQRDRNHPSIILYSAGNEIHDTPKQEQANRILAGLMKEFHATDPTRPVTQALLRPNISHDYTDGLADQLDVVGTNYRMSELLAAQRDKPTRLIIGTENGINDVRFLADHENLAGIFIWSGTDYLGESRAWPLYADGSGLFDRINQPRAAAYYARATWSQAPFMHVARGTSRVGAIPLVAPGQPGGDPTALDPGDAAAAAPPAPATQPGRRRRRPPGPAKGPGPTADWTPANLQPHPETVWIYSNCPKVELTFNGVAIPPNADPAIPNGTHTFAVQFAPGILKATGYDATGKVAATDELRTAGAAAHITLVCDSKSLPHDFDDTACVHATITDADGITVPLIDHEITFTCRGGGTVVATDSADNKFHEPFTSNTRLTFEGKCVAMIKSKADSGTITVTAAAPGLPAATIALEAAPPAR